MRISHCLTDRCSFSLNMFLLKKMLETTEEVAAHRRECTKSVSYRGEPVLQEKGDFLMTGPAVLTVHNLKHRIFCRSHFHTEKSSGWQSSYLFHTVCFLWKKMMSGIPSNFDFRAKSSYMLRVFRLMEKPSRKSTSLIRPSSSTFSRLILFPNLSFGNRAVTCTISFSGTTFFPYEWHRLHGLPSVEVNLGMQISNTLFP